MTRMVTGKPLRLPTENFWRMAPQVGAEHIAHSHLLILTPNGVHILDSWSEMLALPPDTVVLTQWPGKWRSDWFWFLVEDAARATGGGK